MRKKFGNGNLVGGQKKLDVASPFGKITGADFAKLRSGTKKAGGGMIRQMYKKGKSVKKGYHRTKDGRMAKKGLYYYMNRRKKLVQVEKGKGTVTDKALKRSAKTAKA